MGRITQAQHRQQLAAFRQLDLRPTSINRVRQAIANLLGIRPGWRWTRNRMAEQGLLMSREEALEHVRCANCGVWVSPFTQKCWRCGREVR